VAEREDQQEGEAPDRRRVRIVIGALMLAALDQTIVSTALSTIVGELGGLYGRKIVPRSTR
jgi:hypothetical protein